MKTPQPTAGLPEDLARSIEGKDSGTASTLLSTHRTLLSIAGMKDARTGKPPYFWALLTDPAHRRDMLKDGWKSIGKLFVVALLLDAVYQFIVMRFIYPGEALVVAFVLAIVPYLIVRGLVTRLARR